MSTSKLYETLKIYNSHVNDIVTCARENEKAVYEATSKALRSDAFEQQFSGKTIEDYTDFEKEVLAYISSIQDVLLESKVGENFSKAQKNYSKLLQLLAKE